MVDEHGAVVLGEDEPEPQPEPEAVEPTRYEIQYDHGAPDSDVPAGARSMINAYHNRREIT